MPSNIHSIQLSNLLSRPLEGHLRMGGASPSGEWIGANSQYLTRGGKPWTPILGEIHFSRLPRSEWRDALLKMKAGGVQIAATYIFWNYHEETEGIFDWSGDRDLRAFVRLCAETGLLVYPRIGPWAHGEARLGGFPDWLLAKCAKETRRDTPIYLGYAKILYGQIAAQLAGLLWKDGGPVMGIQIENELADQPAHLRTLKAMAREADFELAEAWEVTFSEGVLDGTGQVYLQIQYIADVARAWIGDELIADDFWYGRIWEIGIRRFAQQLLEKSLRLQFLPLRNDAPVYIPAERRPPATDFAFEQVMRVGPITAFAEYEISVDIDVK